MSINNDCPFSTMNWKNPQLSNYPTEAKLVDELCEELSSADFPVSCEKHGLEFNYASGKTDLIAICAKGKLHAFEAKLTKWQKALDQARRNSCYAHYSYVVLPKMNAKTAIKNRNKFRQHGVGLLTFGNGKPKLEIRPVSRKPFVPWLTEAAKAFASNA